MSHLRRLVWLCWRLCAFVWAFLLQTSNSLPFIQATALNAYPNLFPLRCRDVLIDILCTEVRRKHEKLQRNTILSQRLLELCQQSASGLMMVSHKSN